MTSDTESERRTTRTRSHVEVVDVDTQFMWFARLFLGLRMRNGVETEIERRVPRERLDRLAKLVTVASGTTADHGFDGIESPFTGRTFGRVPAGTPADVETATAHARKAGRMWAELPTKERKAVIVRFHDLLLDRRDQLTDLIQVETGQARADAATEILDVAAAARYYAYRAPRWLRPRRRSGALPLLTRVREHRHPVGVVGVIGPWNRAFSLPLIDAIPALLAGNATVIKPSERAPFAALAGLELLRKAGVPAAVIHVVTGDGPTVGGALIDGVDYVCFTGGAETGRLVGERAGARGIGCSLELGGKNHAIVLADADLEWTVEGLATGAFTTAGQVCMAPERILVQRERYEAFVEALAARARSLRVEASFDPDVDVGSLIDADQLAKVQAHVDDARSRGARVLAGGHTHVEDGPYLYHPTVLVDVDPEATAVREETFGPVVSVAPFDHVDEAIERANATPYGLNASVWTDDEDRGRSIAERIGCGTVTINDAYLAGWTSVDAPMGGREGSGLGRRHGREGLLKYTDSQTIASQRTLPVMIGYGSDDRTRYVDRLARLYGLLRRMPGLR